MHADPHTKRLSHASISNSSPAQGIRVFYCQENFLSFTSRNHSPCHRNTAALAILLLAYLSDSVVLVRQSTCHLMETKSQKKRDSDLNLRLGRQCSILKYQAKYSCRTIFGARPEECHGLKKSHVSKSIFLMRQFTCHLISNVRSSTHVAQFFATAHNSKRG